jgi:hypothetical protein
MVKLFQEYANASFNNYSNFVCSSFTSILTFGKVDFSSFAAFITLFFVVSSALFVSAYKTIFFPSPLNVSKISLKSLSLLSMSLYIPLYFALCSSNFANSSFDKFVSLNQ